MRKKKLSWAAWLCIALAVILVGSIGACILQTNAGKVKVKDINILTEQQQELHALAFIPEGASAENPVPVVVTSHGWLNSAEVQDAASIELSRRGIMVIAIDAYNHGLSSSTLTDQSIASTDQGLGMIAMVKYVASGVMDYVDLDRIGVMGHSMGGGAAANTLMYFSKQYQAAIEAAKAPDSDGGEEITPEEQQYADDQMIIDAALPTGMSPTIVTDWSIVPCNTGIVFTTYDENGYQTSTKTAFLAGSTDEALGMVKDIDPSITSVEEGQYYGDVNQGTLRVLYQPHTTHPLLHIDPESTADVIDFFTYCFDIDTDLGEFDQVYLVKEIFNMIAMIGLFLLIIPVTGLLLSCPCFAGIRGQEGPKIPRLQGKAKTRFWGGWILTAAVSFLLAVFSVKAAAVKGGVYKPSALLAAPAVGYVALWTLLCSIWGMIWFWWCYKKDQKAGIRTEEMIGWKITGKQFLRTLMLAVMVVGIIYIVVWFCKWAFNTDFRFWVPAFKTFNVQKLPYFFIYLPPFFLFYLTNSLTVNGAARFEGKGEKKNLFVMAVGNIIGCAVICLIQYGVLFSTGTVLWKAEWIGVMMIGFCGWQLFIAPFLLRAFYKLTGKNWLGPLVVSSIFVMSTIMNTALHSSIIH